MTDNDFNNSENEKRFTYENHKVKDNLTGETHSSNMVSVNVLNTLHEEQEKLKERINRQCETIKKQDQQIDNYIDIKAKLNAKITEYETKSEEYELCACSCGAKHNWIKKTALEEFKEEIYGNQDNNQHRTNNENN